MYNYTRNVWQVYHRIVDDISEMAQHNINTGTFSIPDWKIVGRQGEDAVRLQAYRLLRVDDAFLFHTYLYRVTLRSLHIIFMNNNCSGCLSCRCRLYHHEGSVRSPRPRRLRRCFLQ